MWQGARAYCLRALCGGTAVFTLGEAGSVSYIWFGGHYMLWDALTDFCEWLLCIFHVFTNSQVRQLEEQLRIMDQTLKALMAAEEKVLELNPRLHPRTK